MMRSSVVLPEPFGPISATRSPALTTKDTASRTDCIPYDFERFRTINIMHTPVKNLGVLPRAGGRKNCRTANAAPQRAVRTTPERSRSRYRPGDGSIRDAQCVIGLECACGLWFSYQGRACQARPVGSNRLGYTWNWGVSDPTHLRQAFGLALPPKRGQLVLASRSEEHTSELQSRENLVCSLLL